VTGLPLWREEAIAKGHERQNFDCGNIELNAFLARYARQSHESGSAKTYCAVDAVNGRTIFGFYTISPGQIELHRVPLSARPGGGGRHALGGFRLARLAVSKAYQGRGVGGRLLAGVVERCMRVSVEVGGTALLIDAKDETAAAWYALYGAMRLDDRPLSLVMTYAEFNKARVAAGLPPI
jgi:GNAT superfamily N-acetyltransferase